VHLRIRARTAAAVAGLVVSGVATATLLAAPGPTPPTYRTPPALSAQLSDALAGSSDAAPSPGARSSSGEGPTGSPTGAPTGEAAGQATGSVAGDVPVVTATPSPSRSPGTSRVTRAATTTRRTTASPDPTATPRTTTRRPTPAATPRATSTPRPVPSIGAVAPVRRPRGVRPATGR